MCFGQHVRRRQRLAEVVHQRGEADARVARRQPRGHVADHHDVHAGVDLRVVFGALRHAVQRVDFRQQLRQRAAIAQQLQARPTASARPAARDSSCQTRSGTRWSTSPAATIVAHQRQRFRRDGEAQRREARQEARDAQDAHRILGEGRRDVAQHARLEVARAAEGIDQRARLVLARSR